jgi:hypothetical protein
MAAMRWSAIRSPSVAMISSSNRIYAAQRATSAEPQPTQKRESSRLVLPQLAQVMMERGCSWCRLAE